MPATEFSGTKQDKPPSTAIMPFHLQVPGASARDTIRSGFIEAQGLNCDEATGNACGDGFADDCFLRLPPLDLVPETGASVLELQLLRKGMR